MGEGIALGSHGRRVFDTYESNISFVLRFMVEFFVVI